ncbi:cysteine peptidase C50 [Favolaschia claudopus]|uniref:separase n=1 Tax=Favolaschia claudopus TaxID=2862362 RepID=A0AAW0B3A6_9AGAR
MSASTRRSAPTRQKSSRTRPDTQGDGLADKMAAMSLAKPSTKGKEKAKPTPDEQRVSAMRGVNSASQELSTILQSGWKRSSDVPPSKKSSEFVKASASATAAAQHLALLRDMSPGDLDIERAAGSVCGKLVSLEMHDAALAALKEMHPRLCNLLQVAITPSNPTETLYLLSVPLPQSTPDPILLTLVTTFLLHSLTVVTHRLSTAPSVATAVSFVNALNRNSILAWTPFLLSLPTSHTDSILTRTYSCITKLATGLQSSPKAARQAFLARQYALSCLVYASPGKIEPRSFWDQTIKSAGAYFKALGSKPEENDDTTPIILDAFAQMVTRVQSRNTHFLDDKGFVSYCECWMSFANRVGDIATLDRIAVFINNRPGSSNAGVSMTEASDSKPSSDEYVLECTQLCNTLAQTTAILDPKSASDQDKSITRVRETIKALRKDGVPSLLTPMSQDKEILRLSGKLQRAIERARRSAVKMLESDAEDLVTVIQAFLEALVDILEQAQKTKPDADGTTAVLDTLFVLARTRLKVTNPHTYGVPYDFLKRAATFLDIELKDAAADKATYARCISGAFHNLAGTLYQAGRYGAAIRYLQEGCSLGQIALDLHVAVTVADENPASKSEEPWRQLQEQLWRRRELLGVCYSKIGDRKLAFEAFKDCVRSFPYVFYEFGKRSHPAPFESSPAAQQLGTVVDRLTYLGTSELLLPSEKVSAYSLCISDTAILGILLERQTQSLEGSRWKEATRKVIQSFLCDTLKIFDETSMPVRRARTLVKCLDFTYHAGSESFPEFDSSVSMGEQIERMLTGKVLGQDTELSNFCAQYRASAHLWLALHSHRRADPEQSAIVAHHVGAACKILESMAGLIHQSAPKSAVKQKSKPTTTSKRVPGSRRPLSKNATPPQNPVTPPKVKAVVAAPKASVQSNKSLTIDDCERFFALLRLVTRVLGLLTHVLLKVQVLELAKQIYEQQSDSYTDGYISVCSELALEYMKLGKSRRSAGLFTHTVSVAKSAKVPDEVRVMLHLKHAESLAIADDVAQSCDQYSEALRVAERLSEESTGLSTLERVQYRVGRLERAATACHVFALIQFTREDVAASLEVLLQSLRLWNRAVDTLARLNPPGSKPVVDDNPFDMTALRDALPNGDSTGHAAQTPRTKVLPRRQSMGELEWRVSEGLLATIFALCEAYFTRGSAREAEYFAEQAYELAQSLNAPAMAGRALIKKGELQLHQRHLQTAHDTLLQAAALLQNLPGQDIAEIQRLRGDYNQLSAQEQDAQQLYEEATRMLEEFDQTFGVFDGISSNVRKSIGSAREILLPELLATVLRQHIWLLRDDGNGYQTLLERFLTLPAGSRSKAQENALMAKLTLHEVYGRFRTDIFLSSLTESTIALPMGMSTDRAPALAPSSFDILHILDRAEQLFWLDFTLFSRRGDVARVRHAVVSLALIRAFQTSLGQSGTRDPVLVAGLLDASTAVTLSREMLEAIQHKFPPLTIADDLQWPLASRTGSPISVTQSTATTRFTARRNSIGSELEVSDDEIDDDERSLQDYWESVRSKYQSQAPDISTLSASHMSGLPPNWTVVHMSVTEDKSTLFITRQHGGDAQTAPLVFCVPLKGRRDDDEDEHLTFDDAIREFNDIVRLSDEGTRGAVHVKDDPGARARWWKERTALDTRMRELLENIEFCWLGAFKTILSPRPNLTANAISELRVQFDKVFHRALRFQDKKLKTRPAGMHKRAASESQIPSKVTLDDVLLECFSTLSPKCRDEELEDLVFFILDLYQFHSVPVAIAEVDLDQVVIDLRSVLEEHHARLTGRRRGAEPASKAEEDEHTFLILDKNIQGLPWESLPILRGQSVSRIPSVDFLLDRVQLAGWGVGGSTVVDRAPVDPRKGYCVLNPSGDLKRTEGRFKSWAERMETIGWQSTIGRPPTEQQFLDALKKKDLVVYFGHGGAEQYLRSHKIRNLPRCAATMLWGCSSGTLREMGDFDRVGTPYNYMLAGCPTLVANLWDVTDRDIDIFSQSVFDKLNLTADGASTWDATKESQTSLVAAVAQSRASCKLKYLTGAAPIVYGIPFYL